MNKSDPYETLASTLYNCVVCTKAVGCEENLRYDKQGNVQKYYTPESRYWGSKGVYCGSECMFVQHLKDLGK